MAAYYNELDPYAAQWLRNLIAAGHIAPGDVDERSIEDVKPSELIGYDQCHFFAGIGVWSHSLRRAGWPDDRPVWTGSCPCQPFSAAGKRGGTTDERHLWPAWFHLIQNAKPREVPVFGEQVASKDGLAWLDLVQADLEGQGYAVGAIDCCAAGVGAPHIRQRLYFVADAERNAAEQRRSAIESASCARLASAGPSTESGRRGLSGGVAHGYTDDARPQGRRVSGADSERQGGSERAVGTAGVAGDSAVGDAFDESCERNAGSISGTEAQINGARIAVNGGLLIRPEHASASVGSAANGFWSAADWLHCIDGKARPVEPGTFPLAHGAPARVGRLRAYGNAIVAPLAEEIIRAYMLG